MSKTKFTAGRVDGFTCQAGKIPSFLWDSAAPGLGLRAAPGGGKADLGESLRLKRFAEPLPQRQGTGGRAAPARMARRTLRITGKGMTFVDLWKLEIGIVGSDVLGPGHVEAVSIPLLLNSAVSSPAWNISRTMSQPPTNSPLT